MDNMTKSKNNQDFISEQEFTAQSRGASTNPQEDSPGDSGKDAGTEFAMGINYQPIASGLADADEKFRNETSSMPRPNNLAFTPQEPKIKTPTSVIIKSEAQPPPPKSKDKKQTPKLKR